MWYQIGLKFLRGKRSCDTVRVGEGELELDKSYAKFQELIKGQNLVFKS